MRFCRRYVRFDSGDGGERPQLCKIGGDKKVTNMIAERVYRVGRQIGEHRKHFRVICVLRGTVDITEMETSQ